MKPSLYIHIPFCKRKCIYCDFYSVINDPGLASRYIDVITRQIDHLNGQFHTIYIGGGTPTALGRLLLAKLFNSIKSSSAGVPEFTVEANPESLDEDKIKLFLDSGVNRVSIGVQSLNEKKLKSLGRIHDVKKALRAVEMSAKKGFKNISIDLIFGVWDETLEGWKGELEKAVKLPIAHVSCYSLTYEKGTPLFISVNNKSIRPLEDDIVAAMYETAIEMLSLRGFKQYEISNFSKAGYECRHNMYYWENNPYVGLGASAVSYIDGVRAKNMSDAEEYIRRINDGDDPVKSSEKLSPVKSALETAAIKIRTKDGIDFNWFKNKTGFDFCELEKAALPGLIEKELIKYKREKDAVTGVCLKRKGFLFSDTVSSALL